MSVARRWTEPCPVTVPPLMYASIELWTLFVLYDPPPEIPPETVYPLLNSQASDNTIRGGMLLFKVTTDSLYNRPLELKIIDPEGGPDGMINLDI